MSSIVVQVGQCGNQVGSSLFNTIFDDCFASNCAQSDYLNESKHRFFNETKSTTLECRAIQIDTEEKVIMNRHMNSDKWDYSIKCRYVQKAGSGNNWANGYYKNGNRIIETFDEMLRYQLELSDSVDGILLTMSVAGGTGSGVGACLCRHLRETLSKTVNLAHLVLPYQHGEVSVQSYNAVLSMASILGMDSDGMLDSSLSVDAVVIHENDVIHQACANRLSRQKVCVSDLNTLICHQLASTLQPVNQTKLPISDIILENVLHPDYRILKLRNVPYFDEKCRDFSTDTWNQLIKHINQMILTESLMEDGLQWNVNSKTKMCRLISNHVIIRGLESDSVDPFSSCLNDKQMFSPLFLNQSSLKRWNHCRPFNRYEKSITALTNGKDSVNSLDTVVGKAWQMFGRDAFIYQYEKYGMTKNVLLDSFANCEQIIHNYLSL